MGEKQWALSQFMCMTKSLWSIGSRSIYFLKRNRLKKNADKNVRLDNYVLIRVKD